MFQTLVSVLGAFVGLSVHGAANRKYYDSDCTPVELKYFIGTCLQVLVFSTSLVFVFVLLFRNILGTALGLAPSWVLWAVFMSAATFLVNLRLGQWQVRKEAIKYGALQFSKSVFNVVVTLLLVVYLTYGADGRISAQLIATFAAAVVAIVYLQRDSLLGFQWSTERMKEVLSFGVPLIPHVVGIVLLNVVDRIVINAELGLASAGIYMVAVQITAGFALVFDAINKAYVPWLFERLSRDNEREKQLVVRYTYIYFIVILCCAGIMFLIGPAAVRIVAGESYAAAGEVIGILAIGQVFGGMYLMVTNYAFYAKRTGLLSIATITSGLLNLGLLIGLVHFYGMIGAAIAFSIAMVFRFLSTWWVAQRVHPMPWFSFR